MEKIMRVPMVGDTVLYLVPIYERQYNNGQGVCPALVTSVHGIGCVNLHILFDGDRTQWKSSVMQGVDPNNWKFRENELLNTIHLSMPDPADKKIMENPMTPDEAFPAGDVAIEVNPTDEQKVDKPVTKKKGSPLKDSESK